MNENYSNKLACSTQIRNLYSDGNSYLNIKFFNTNLSLQFFKFSGKDETGRSSYQKQGLMTTVNFEAAYALYQASHDILTNKLTNEMRLVIPCAGGATLLLERRKNQNGVLETALSINKNGEIIPFVFSTITRQIQENNTFVTNTIESGLGAFTKTIDGYLTGINSERHLNKLTEEYVKSLGENASTDTANTNANPPQQYQSNSNYQKPYNPNYQRKQYNRGNFNNYNRSRPQWDNNNPPQQTISQYNIP